MLNLHSLKIHSQAKSKKQRRGRGNASGRGNYSGRGMKGQRSRSGGKSGLKRLGMKKIILQLPKKKGFNRQSKRLEIINLRDLENNFSNKQEVNTRGLFKLGLITNTRRGVKVLAQGQLTKSLIVKAHSFSKTAEQAIIKAGGQAIITAKHQDQKARPIKDSKTTKTTK